MSVAVKYTASAHEQSDALGKQLNFARRVLKEALDVEVKKLRPFGRVSRVHHAVNNNEVYLVRHVSTALADVEPSPGDSSYTYKLDAFLKARNVGTFTTIPHFQVIASLYQFGELLMASGGKVKKTIAKSVSCFDKDLKMWGS